MEALICSMILSGAASNRPPHIVFDCVFVFVMRATIGGRFPLGNLIGLGHKESHDDPRFAMAENAAADRLPDLQFAAFCDGACVALSLQSPDNGNILICTAQGFEWISVDEFDQDDLPAAGHSHDCPLCFVAAQAVNTPGLAPFTLPAAVTRMQPATTQAAKAHQFYRLAYASCAPPI